jgi:hypothetical protein
MRRVALLAMMATGVLLAATPVLAAGQSDLAKARQATAKFHDVGKAEAAGYGSTLGTPEEPSLGCFENEELGGMGVHYVNGLLLEDEGALDPAKPEALVYEMRPNGQLKLVALEYIVLASDVDDPSHPPMLFGQHFHAHSSLPLYVLHVWIWQPNPSGMFADWNPRVGMCPDGVPIFGS